MRIIYFAEGKQTPWSQDAAPRSAADEARARSELDARLCDFAIRVRDTLAARAALDLGSCREETRWLAPLTAALKQIHPGLDLDWLPEPKQLVLRAWGARELYPLIDLLCDQVNAACGESDQAGAARKYLVGLLPPLGHAVALPRASLVLGRDFSGARVRVGFVRGHLLELAFAVPGCAGHLDAEALEAATSYAEAALGERVLDEWVGSIGVSPAPRGGPLRVVDSRQGAEGETAPVSQLSALVERGIESLTLGLPDHALDKDRAGDWTLLDSTPIELPDGSVSMDQMDDVLMAATRCPELLKCYLEGLPVSSRRFSRVGETFVYLKLPCSAPLPERPALREAVERELEIAIGDTAVLVGNAVGAAHIYIVLALRELTQALDRLLPLAPGLAALVPHGSTLRFLDTAWQREWLTLR